MFSDTVHVTGSGSSVKLSRTYAITQKLGEGGMGEVFKVCYNQMGEVRWAAMKILDKTKFSSQRDLDIAISRFHREVKLLSRVRHLNIIGFLDCFEDAERAYLVMDYAEGVTMDKWVKQFSGDAPYALVVDIIMDVLDALVYMQEVHGMNHRDIKPDNIMIQTLPNGKVRAMLIDFGNTKVPKEDNSAVGLTMTSGKIAGSLGYATMEVVLKVYEEPEDMFALAATMFFGLLGVAPFVPDEFNQEGFLESMRRINERDYDLGQWKNTFLGHWIEQNVDPDRTKRMSLKYAHRSLSRFRENLNFLGKCPAEKVNIYAHASEAALLNFYEQFHSGEVQFTPPPEPVNVSEFGRSYGDAANVVKSAPAAPTPADVDPVAAKSLSALDKALATPIPESKRRFKHGLVNLAVFLAMAAGAGAAYWLGLIP